MDNKKEITATSDVCIEVDNLKLSYGDAEALHGISLDIPKPKCIGLVMVGSIIRAHR